MTKSRNRYPTSSDVARLAGVSQSAVSRTFTRDASISTALREKVLAAARELGYRPNALPGIMQGQRSRMIAVVVGGMYNPFYARVLDTLTDELQARGEQVLLSRVESDHALDEAIDQITRYRVDAVVSALAVTTEETARKLSASRIPVVAFNSTLTAPWVSAINSDNAAAGRQAADLLLARGARRFGFIHGPLSSPAEQERFDGFAKRLVACGNLAPAEARGDYDYGGGQAAIRELWRAAIPPDAIFCANDLMALGAIDTLRHELSVPVPRSVRIIGYDNIDSCDWLGYQLTSFDQDVNTMVEGALSLIFDREDLGEKSVTVTVLPKLVERSSTR